MTQDEYLKARGWLYSSGFDLWADPTGECGPCQPGRAFAIQAERDLLGDGMAQVTRRLGDESLLKLVAEAMGDS